MSDNYILTLTLPVLGMGWDISLSTTISIFPNSTLPSLCRFSI